MDEVLAYIRSFAPAFSEEGWKVLQSIITRVELRKGAYLLEAGKPCHSLFLISKGYCRAFYLQDGLEINTAFYFENEVATNINSYVRNQRSSFAIQACEPLIAYRFDKSDVLQAGRQAPEIEAAGKQSLQLIAARQEQQIEMYRLLSAAQRYEYLERHQPQLLQRVSLTHLSSYLGVARETLSRIRKKRLGK